MATDYTLAHQKIEEAINLLKDYPDFESVREDLIILKDKLADMIW